MSLTTQSPGGRYPNNPVLNPPVAQSSVAGGREVNLGSIVHLPLTAAEAAAASTTAVHAAITQGTGVATVTTTGITNPPYPRNLTVTGNQGTVAGVATILGTNDADQAISETFTLNGTATVVGAKAFKTVTEIDLPARAAAADTVAVGFGSKLGLPHLLTRNSVLSTYFNNVEEVTAPTVVVSSTALESNTVTLDTTLDGTNACGVYYII